jgi:hypothetical protein
MTIPSVGRVVHLLAPNGECTAAVVSVVQNETLLTLTTFPVSGPNVVASVPYDGHEQPMPETWHWPERV